MKMILENTKQLNVLYVEDNKILLQATRELFETLFLKLDIALDGVDGLASYREFYEEYGNYYDIVITDINMPEMDGLTMVEQMLKVNSEQSIIITTAHNDMEYLTKAINLGVDGFITKPFENKKLIKVLNKTAQAISDRKFVLSHVDMIEDLNILLDKQNKELLTKNTELEKSFRMLDTVLHKEKLVQPKNEISTPEAISPTNERLQEQIQSLIHDDLDELRELHSDIDLDVIAIINNTDLLFSGSTLKNLTTNFSRYSSILSFYNFFDDLSKGISAFSRTLQDTPLPSDNEVIKNVFMLLESFMYVLGKWHNDLASGNADTINSFDASIISDMHTITNMWTQTNIQNVVEEDINDIFDF